MPFSSEAIFEKTLIIDTDLNSLSVTRSLLNQLHIVNVDIASSVDESVVLCKENSYDLIILDYYLGDIINGAELLIYLRQNELISTNIATLVCSTDSSKKVVLRVLQALPDAFLVKPLSLNNLKAKLETALKQKEIRTPIFNELENKGYTHAIDLCWKNIHKHQYAPNLINLLLNLLIENHDWEQVVLTSEKILKKQPNLHTEVIYARALFATGQKEKSITLLKNIIEKTPLLVEAYDFLAQFYRQEKEFIQALFYAQQAQDLVPASSHRLILTSRLAIKVGDSDALIKSGLKLANHLPTFDFLWFDRMVEYAGIYKQHYMSVSKNKLTNELIQNFKIITNKASHKLSGSQQNKLHQLRDITSAGLYLISNEKETAHASIMQTLSPYFYTPQNIDVELLILALPTLLSLGETTLGMMFFSAFQSQRLLFADTPILQEMYQDLSPNSKTIVQANRLATELTNAKYELNHEPQQALQHYQEILQEYPRCSEAHLGFLDAMLNTQEFNIAKINESIDLLDAIPLPQAFSQRRYDLRHKFEDIIHPEPEQDETAEKEDSSDFTTISETFSEKTEPDYNTPSSSVTEHNK